MLLFGIEGRTEEEEVPQIQIPSAFGKLPEITLNVNYSYYSQCAQDSFQRGKKYIHIRDCTKKMTQLVVNRLFIEFSR